MCISEETDNGRKKTDRYTLNFSFKVGFDTYKDSYVNNFSRVILIIWNLLLFFYGKIYFV